jgi:hypothetical protein
VVGRISSDSHQPSIIHKKVQRFGLYTALTLSTILGLLLFVWTQKEDPLPVARDRSSSDFQCVEEGLQALFFRDFGYTLLGVKPISQSDNLSAYVFGGEEEAKRVFVFLQNAFKNSSQFILRMPRENAAELIHKKSLERQIQLYPDLQRFIENKYGSTAIFLNTLSTSKKSIFSLLGYNTLFIGICFGYGEQNSKFYIRKHWVGAHLKKLRYFTPFPFDQSPDIYHVRGYSYFVYPDLERLAPVPSDGFDSLEEEWRWIKSVEIEPEEEDPDPPFTILLPGYASMACEESTHLHAKYVRAKDKLAKLFCGRKLSEVIIEKAGGS